MRAINDGLVTMREIEVDTQEVLDIVKRNRGTHVKSYQQALKDRQDVALAKAKKELARAAQELREADAAIMAKINAMKPEDPDGLPQNVVVLSGIAFTLPVPQNRSKDYDAVISMLELEKRERIKLDSAQHACFILDDWDWKDDFLSVSESYSSTKQALGLA